MCDRQLAHHLGKSFFENCEKWHWQLARINGSSFFQKTGKMSLFSYAYHSTNLAKARSRTGKKALAQLNKGENCRGTTYFLKELSSFSLAINACVTERLCTRSSPDCLSITFHEIAFSLGNFFCTFFVIYWFLHRYFIDAFISY